MRFLLFFLIFFTASTFVFSGANSKINTNWLSDWEKRELTDDGIASRCRQHKSELYECHFELEAQISLKSLIAINTDVDGLKNWMANVMTSENVDPSLSKTDYHVYNTYSFPGAVSRDSITHSIVTQNPTTLAITLAFTTDSKIKAKPENLSKHFRFPFIKGAWVFTPLSNGNTKIGYTNIGIPGGYVQKFMKTLYNIGAYDASINTIRDMLIKAKESQYQNAEVDYVKLPVSVETLKHNQLTVVN